MSERGALRIAILLASLVPVAAGLTGVVRGVAWLDVAPGVDAQSHGRYLSGLLLGIGIAFALSARRIDTAGPTLRLLGGIVVLGGLARLAGLIVDGAPSAGHLFGLVMELVVTPGLVGWQATIAQRGGAASTGTVGR